MAFPFSIEVVAGNGALQGYLHPNCKEEWEESHPDFNYGRPQNRLVLAD
jgi:hypothetical protein